MIDFNHIKESINTISMPVHNEDKIEQDVNVHQLSQHDLMLEIHFEFQKTFIRKLYPNPIWTERIFWNIVGTIQLNNSGMVFNEIIIAVKRYLSDHKMMIPLETR